MTATHAAHRLEAGQPIEIEVAGQALQLGPNESLMSTTSPSGYAVAENEGLVTALNTTLTPVLMREGLARDLVRLMRRPLAKTSTRSLIESTSSMSEETRRIAMPCSRNSSSTA